MEVRAGDAEALPVEDAGIDVVISNGVLNLVPDKRKAYAEIARVLAVSESNAGTLLYRTMEKLRRGCDETA